MMVKCQKDFDFSEWYEIARPILEHPEFQKRKTFAHHGSISVYEHVIMVSMQAYKMAKKRNLNYRDATIAGLLHDFYTTPWMEDTIKKPILKRHAFIHAEVALNNAKEYFSELLNPTIENTILRHMFPLNIRPPKYLVGWIVTLADKIVSIECFHEPKFIKGTIKGAIGR